MNWEDVPCKLWTGATHPKGYGARRYKGETWTAHKAAWDEHNGPVPEGLNVLHRCDVRNCYEITHLFLGTQADNIADMVAKGRQAKGSRNGHAKLTEEKVREIRTRCAARVQTQRSIAREYGVTEQTISDIVHRRKWAHIS